MEIIDTTVAETLAFINSIYPDPVKMEWHPSEYDMKYKYNTPRKQKKLEADKAKEDAKLEAAFQKEVATKAKAIATINEVGTYPAEVAKLFLNTLYWKVAYLKKCHEKHLACIEELKKYGDDIASEDYNIRYYLEKHETSYSPSGRRTTRTYFSLCTTDESWNNLVEKCKGRFTKQANGEYGYTYPLKRITDKAKFIEDCINLFQAADDDEVSGLGDYAYAEAIRQMAESLDGIMEDIKKYFNGNKPNKCLTDAQWGYKGEFCGILTDGATKVSFKSFAAGGWNIQKYHFRFKATKLKA